MGKNKEKSKTQDEASKAIMDDVFANEKPIHIHGIEIKFVNSNNVSCKEKEFLFPFEDETEIPNDILYRERLRHRS